jgi:hypothetical protein
MKCLKLQITSGLLGLGALLMASQASAATVFLDPSATTVGVAETFTITAKGSGFTDGVAGGNITLIWDPTVIEATSTLDQIIATAPTGFSDLGFPLPDSTLVSGQLDLDLGSFSSTTSAFDWFTIGFIAIAPTPTTVVDITSNIWLDGATFLEIDIAGVTDLNATVTVSAVPVPAAAWLFASGLIGLVGVARRKTQLA